MPDPTVPDAIASTRDHAPPLSVLPDPALRSIDLAASARPDFLDDGARERLARAGQDALDACLRRFTPEERTAFWRAICRCYNRPYNPVELPPVELPSSEGAVPDGTEVVPAAHVIDAVRPGPDVTLPEAALR